MPDVTVKSIDDMEAIYGGLARCARAELMLMADCAVEEDRFEEAARLMKDGLGILRDAGNLLMSVAAVCRTARVLALAGRPRPAALVLSSASVLLEEIGAKPPGSRRSPTRR